MELLEERYDVAAIARRIFQHGFLRVALQFPDELLVDSVKVASALRRACGSAVRFFVMADTTFGSCCVDEVAAAHVNAQCVVHYGHACMSPVASLPVLFSFGRSFIDLETASDALNASSSQPLMVLYDLDYAYAIPELRNIVQQRRVELDVTFADIVGTEVNFPHDVEEETEQHFEHVIAGLKWNAPRGMHEYTLVWIGKEGPALTSVMLSYSTSTTLRFDPNTGKTTEMSTQSRALQRRLYLIEQAKIADIVGIVVGTLGVAGYFEAIEKIKQMVKDAGKRSYTMVVGKPNPAKLANFPECDVFVLVACSQTAFIDSKDYAAPLITPFEAQLAFVRGSQWTGSLCLDFQKLNFDAKADDEDEEAEFSFLKGGYFNDARKATPDENGQAEHQSEALVVMDTNRELAATSGSRDTNTRSASDFFSGRTFQGISLVHDDDASIRSEAVRGRKGRASVYEGEVPVK